MLPCFCLALTLVAACGDDSAVMLDLPECAPCDSNARCVLTGDTAACECNPGFSGDGLTCTDTDECATANGGCDTNATCTNEAGYRTCMCNADYEGDGVTCAPRVDIARAGCAVREAEHPGYTNIARDVVLCGSKYTPTDIANACSTNWHVCRKTEWLGRYPTNRSYGMVPDPTPATLGLYTSWGEAQAFRCNKVWIANAPVETTAYAGPVCYYPGDVGTNNDGADYLPNNNGKFLFDDDGTTILHGLNGNGDQDCCSWDVSFEATSLTDGFAVYCCRN